MFSRARIFALTAGVAACVAAGCSTDAPAPEGVSADDFVAVLYEIDPAVAISVIDDVLADRTTACSISPAEDFCDPSQPEQAFRLTIPSTAYLTDFRARLMDRS